MSYQIDLDIFERTYAQFSRQVRDAVLWTFEEEAEEGLTQREISETLGINEALVSRRLHGLGNITLRTLCDLYTAMGREPLSNFQVPYKQIPNGNPRSSGPTVTGTNEAKAHYMSMVS